jgi:CubicO group peptidase (beta-lactamase class C family)
LNSIGYNPLKRSIPKLNIMPTENDTRFRHQLIRGYVHDQGAALCGGVQGHAGLFANASDLAVLFAMLEQNGQWEGVQYLKPSTVHLFTSKQSKVSRRGLGFDKQSPQRITDSPTCPSASTATFGHTGFTGTSVWSDPISGITFVFLSNRVCPNASNKKIIELGVRTNLQELFYQALNEQNH